MEAECSVCGCRVTSGSGFDRWLSRLREQVPLALAWPAEAGNGQVLRCRRCEEDHQLQDRLKRLGVA